MNKLKKLEKEINEIGKKMVECDVGCEGVRGGYEEDRKKGIIPRCLILDKESLGPEKKEIVVIVGLNPGKSKGPEREIYKEAFYNKKSGSSLYNVTVKHWEDARASGIQKGKYHKWSYYARIIEILRDLDFRCPILWTELCKCECNEGKKIPAQTMRNCINKYLREELSRIPEIKIFAIGNIAFDFCSLAFPKNPVFGIPHPTGSHIRYENSLKYKLKNNDRKRKCLKIIRSGKDKKGNLLAIKLNDVK